MMRGSRWLACAAIVAAVLAVPVRAQDALAQMREAARQFDAWMTVIGEFTRGVEFDEADVRRLIEHWEGFEQFDVAQDDKVISPEEFRAQLAGAERDPEYRQWAKAIGADPDTWLRKAMRIQAAVMIDQAAALRVEWDAERSRQVAAVEAQCAQLPPEQCAEMKGMFAAGAEMADKMLQSRDKLPKSTAAESALIEKHRLELLSVVQDEMEAAGEFE